jgi:uncharacterized protein (TIGR03067 family)
MTQDGKENSGEEVQLIQLTFKGDKVTFSVFGKGHDGDLKVDDSKDPKQIDLTLDGRPQLGIYRVAKDTLTLCLREGGGERPTAFAAGKRSNTVLLVLKRGAAKLDPAVAKKAIEKVQLAAQRATSQNNLKQMALAFHNYYDTYKRLPTAASYSKDGKPLLSWRVAILPFVEEGQLFREFKLDEPWDSEHNKKLLARMPKLYEPVRGKTKEPHSTFYQVFTGPDTPFTGPKPARIPATFRDGLSQTILIVEAGEAVPWTKPADIPYDAKQPLPKLGGLFEQGFNMAMGDGSVMWVNRLFDERILRGAITPAGGEDIDLEKLSR